MNDIECESAIAAPLHLVPSHEEPAHTFEDVLGCLRNANGTPAKLLGRFHPGIIVNAYFQGDRAVIDKHACALGCEASSPSGLAHHAAAGRRTVRWRTA